MAGKDAMDSTTIDREKSAYTDINDGLSDKRIGVVSEFMGEGLDNQVKAVIEQKIAEMKKMVLK